MSDGLELDASAPTEEQIEELEEKLESAQSEQKNLFLIIFQVCVCDESFYLLLPYKYLSIFDCVF